MQFGETRSSYQLIRGFSDKLSPDKGWAPEKPYNFDSTPVSSLSLGGVRELPTDRTGLPNNRPSAHLINSPHYFPHDPHLNQYAICLRFVN